MFHIQGWARGSSDHEELKQQKVPLGKAAVPITGEDGSGREREMGVVCMCPVWAEGGVAGDPKYKLVSSSHPGKSGGRVSEGSSQNGEALHCTDLPHLP